MKRWKPMVWMILLVASEAVTATPFWCGGNEKFSDHPLDFDKIGNELQNSSSLPVLYQNIHDRFVTHVTDIGEQYNENVLIAQGMFDDLLNPRSPSFLRHVPFRWRDLELHGIEKNCTNTAEDIQNQQPGLAAVYAAFETTNLAGRQANRTSIDSELVIIRRNWKETNAWLLEDGLPQWPWEMKLNEKLLNTDSGNPTPKSQYLFLRPSLGLNLSYPRQEDADIAPTGALEVFGKIWYRDSYKKHWGLALITGIDTDNGAGIGLSFRTVTGLVSYNTPTIDRLHCMLAWICMACYRTMKREVRSLTTLSMTCHHL